MKTGTTKAARISNIAKMTRTLTTVMDKSRFGVSMGNTFLIDYP
jgi:hypothetical protein